MGNPFYVVTEAPAAWAARNPKGKAIVSITPWSRSYFSLGGVQVKGRKAWGAGLPIWRNEVVYYNTAELPLLWVLGKIIVHHTNNAQPILANERTQQARGYAAIGYHFFIDKGGNVYEGRPLEVMGSHAGTGKIGGPLNDPDWGAVGIVLQGDYHHADDAIFKSVAPSAQLLALEKLVIGLKGRFSINQLLMHNEIERTGEVTVCPGDHIVPHVQHLRSKLKMRSK